MLNWDQVALIYQEGIETGNATFEQSVHQGITGLNHPLEFDIVAFSDNEILGWVALSSTDGEKYIMV